MKFIPSEYEESIWQAVYVAAIRGGRSIPAAIDAADSAVLEMRSRR